MKRTLRVLPDAEAELQSVAIWYEVLAGSSALGHVAESSASQKSPAGVQRDDVPRGTGTVFSGCAGLLVGFADRLFDASSRPVTNHPRGGYCVGTGKVVISTETSRKAYETPTALSCDSDRAWFMQ